MNISPRAASNVVWGLPTQAVPMVRREMNRKVMETAMGRVEGARYQVPGTLLGSQVPSMVRSRCSLVGANPCRTPHLLPFAHMALLGSAGASLE